MKLIERTLDYCDFAASLGKEMLLKYIELELQNLNEEFPWIKTVSDAYHTRRIVFKSETHGEALERIKSLFEIQESFDSHITSHWDGVAMIERVEKGALEFLYALVDSACETNRFYVGWTPTRLSSDRNMILEFGVSLRLCPCKECVGHDCHTTNEETPTESRSTYFTVIAGKWYLKEDAKDNKWLKSEPYDAQHKGFGEYAVNEYLDKRFPQGGWGQ